MVLVANDTGIAVWRQVADSLARAIASGRFVAGQKLPGETELAETFQVNRHTVRRALASLAERGLLRAERGSGTYVETKRLAYPLRSRTRFSDIVGAGGHEPRGTLIEAQNETGTPEICSRLDLARGTTVIRIDAVRLADRTPICIGSSWLPQERFPDATKIYRRHGSLTRVLAAHGVTDYRRATTRVTASLADAFDATHLDISIGAPVLVVDSVDTDLKGRPVLACATRFAAERVEFVIETR